MLALPDQIKPDSTIRALGDQQDHRADMQTLPRRERIPRAATAETEDTGGTRRGAQRVAATAAGDKTLVPAVPNVGVPVDTPAVLPAVLPAAIPNLSGGFHRRSRRFLTEREAKEGANPAAWGIPRVRAGKLA